MNFAIVAQQLRAEVTFKKVQELLHAQGIPLLLLKGPHLSYTVYEAPKDRLYGDVDILVKPKDFDLAAETLLRNDFQACAYDRFAPEIQDDFKHWELRSPWGIVVEIHRWLSGHDRYPIDIDGLFARAVDFNYGETKALGLATEDLLLHLCLHMGTSYFQAIERKHITDIALLIARRNVDWQAFSLRTQHAGAQAIAFYALLAARQQEKALVPEALLDGLRPGAFRRLWLERSIDPATFPIYRFPDHPMKCIKRRLILPLMDRPGQWVKLSLRMAGTQIKKILRKIDEN